MALLEADLQREIVATGGKICSAVNPTNSSNPPPPPPPSCVVRLSLGGNRLPTTPSRCQHRRIPGPTIRWRLVPRSAQLYSRASRSRDTNPEESGSEPRGLPPLDPTHPLTFPCTGGRGPLAWGKGAPDHGGAAAGDLDGDLSPEGEGL